MQYITSRQMVRIEKLANDFGISNLQMMENAGRCVARFVLGKSPKKAVIMYGKGNNGGDGLACARHMVTAGLDVELVAASSEPGALAARQLKSLRHAGVPEKAMVKAGDGDIVVDALLGTSIKGSPRGRYGQLIEAANRARENGAEIVSIDIPSGIDPDTGSSFTPRVNADYVVTLGLAKTGLQYSNAPVYLANIGLPPGIYRDAGINSGDYFEESDIVPVGKNS
jgi:NAD(P)H-hydrate epimerase